MNVVRKETRPHPPPYVGYVEPSTEFAADVRTSFEFQIVKA